MYQLRAVVIDDSIVFRSKLIDAFSTFSNVRVAGFAGDGRAGLEKIQQLKPDIVTLDIEMPVLNGIETLKIIKQDFPAIQVIMVSAFTNEGSRETIKALEIGALDFITKPDKGSVEENKSALQEQLKQIIVNLEKPQTTVPQPVFKTPGHQTKTTVSGTPSIIGIGSSTGGPKALSILIPQLPASLPVPIVITQHMPPLFTASLAESLNNKGSLPVVEAHKGDILNNGTVYIAPGGFQMGVELLPETMTKQIVLSDDPPENFCKPSVDYLFRSLAKIYRDKAIGIILTGMGKDGALGLSMMKKFGARTIAQNEQTCTVFGMPREAILSGAADQVLPIDQIAQEIGRILHQSDNNH